MRGTDNSASGEVSSTSRWLATSLQYITFAKEKENGDQIFTGTA